MAGVRSGDRGALLLAGRSAGSRQFEHLHRFVLVNRSKEIPQARSPAFVGKSRDPFETLLRDREMGHAERAEARTELGRLPNERKDRFVALRSEPVTDETPLRVIDRAREEQTVDGVAISERAVQAFQ